MLKKMGPLQILYDNGWVDAVWETQLSSFLLTQLSGNVDEFS